MMGFDVWRPFAAISPSLEQTGPLSNEFCRLDRVEKFAVHGLNLVYYILQT